MASLRTHLTAGLTIRGGHDRLPFHDDCPFCRDISIAGTPPPAPLAARRAPALLTAGVLAFSALAPSGAALATPPVPLDDEGSGEPQTPQRPGEEAPSFDPGAEELLEPEAPPPAPLTGGDEQDDSPGGPLESEPDDRLEAVDVPPPPPTQPAPPPEPLPAPEPQTLAPELPAPAPAAPQALRPQTPIGEPGERQRLRLLVGGVDHRPATDDELPQSVGGEQPSRPPAPTRVPPPSTTVPLAPEIPTTASRDSDRAPDQEAPVAPRAGNGETHMVRAGESLWSIAEQLVPPRASDAAVARIVERLWKLNADSIATGNPDILPIGIELTLR